MEIPPTIINNKNTLTIINESNGWMNLWSFYLLREDGWKMLSPLLGFDVLHHSIFSVGGIKRKWVPLISQLFVKQNKQNGGGGSSSTSSWLLESGEWLLSISGWIGLLRSAVNPIHQQHPSSSCTYKSTSAHMRKMFVKQTVSNQFFLHR